MRVVQVAEPGDPGVLGFAEVPDPVPGPGEVLIGVAATAVNRADCLQRRGQYPPPPGASSVLGLEAAGRVLEVGPGSTRHAVGDMVFALLPGGGYAERVVAPESVVLPVPHGMDVVAAAAVAEVFLTAFQALHWLAGVAADDVVLVHAGASGVGSAAIQVAKLAGATVLVTAGSDDKCARCVELGARAACNYREADFVEFVSGETGGAGANVVIDFVGGPYLARNIDALAIDGRLVLLALLGGRKAEAVDLARWLQKRVAVSATTLRNRSDDYKARLVEDFAERCLPAFASGELAPVIDRVLPWTEVAEAHRLLEANGNVGKVVLRVT